MTALVPATMKNGKLQIIKKVIYFLMDVYPVPYIPHGLMDMHQG